ncbi:MAG: 50S ribosomal protein L24 [Candidatus Nomurabacteria bacterium]|jgi:large subunit ribosomal protein L24|nr:50S ribosomal protein L24 [Candidatus Nomurabacteria bacterium]
MLRIKKGDNVKIIRGGLKGQTGKVVRIDTAENLVWLDGVNVKERHIARNRLINQGGKRDITAPIALSNVALIVGEKDKTSRVGFKLGADGKKIRFAKTSGKEIK